MEACGFGLEGLHELCRALKARAAEMGARSLAPFPPAPATAQQQLHQLPRALSVPYHLRVTACL